MHKTEYITIYYRRKIVFLCFIYWTKSHTESHTCLIYLGFTGCIDSIEEAAKAGKF